MAPSRHNRDYHSRNRSRSRSHSHHRHNRSRSRSYSDDERSSSHRRSYRDEREPTRIIRDEFGREVKEKDIRRMEREIRERNQIENVKESIPKEPPPAKEKEEEYEIEEGEDISANMREIMGFGSFSSTKGKHVKDNDSLVNRGAVRKVKQFKAMRILNRKAKI